MLRRVGTLRLGDIVYTPGVIHPAMRVEGITYRGALLKNISAASSKAMLYLHDALVDDRESEAALVEDSREALEGCYLYPPSWNRVFILLSKHDEGVVLEDRTTGEIVRLPYPKES